MVNSSNVKNALLIVLVTASIFACKKKEETPEPEPVVDNSVPCFNSNYNGNYVGSGFTLSSPFTAGTLTVSKTNCQTASLHLITNTSSNINEQVSQLVLNSSGGYSGKLNNGNDISLTLGTNLQVNAVGSFTFNGVRKP